MYRTPKDRATPDQTFFVTIRTADNNRIFADSGAAQIALASLQYFREKNEAELYGYVIMTDHIHVVIKPKSPLNISSWLRRFKTFTAHAIDKGPIWQPGAWTEVIRSDKWLRQKLNYIHENPVRAGLVSKPEEFLLSSAHECMGKDVYQTIDYAYGPPISEEIIQST